MNPARIADCDACGTHGLMTCQYEHHDSVADVWSTYLFCAGKCLRNWELSRNGMPNPGIVTTLRHVPGQEREL